MQRRMIVIVPAVLVMPFAAAWLTAGSSLAGPAADECLSRPGASAPAGSHWYYRVIRADHRHCWYLGPVGAKVRAQARETASPSPSRSPQRPAETWRAAAAETTPAPAPAAPAPTEPPVPEDAVPQFAARWSDLPRSVAVGAREPAAASSAYAEEHADAQDEMPLIWPVLTEAELAGAPQSALASDGRPTVLVGALALLLAGAVFKLTVARRPGRSHRGDRAVVAPPHPFRSASPGFADTAGCPAHAVRAAVAMARRDDRRRESDERARDIEARLQQLRRDRLRAA